MKKLMLLLLWFPATVATILLSLQTYTHIAKTHAMQALISAEANSISLNSSGFFAYAALPQTANNIKTTIATGDARPVVIDLYFERFSSPLAGYGELIITLSEKYNIDPYLFVAIAQQESNLGKKMPADDCHNAWGYGIHTKGRLCFNSWEEGIESVMKGLAEKYIEQGLTEPEDIMKIYTPRSNGSWAKGVRQFMQELHTGQF